MCRVRQKTLEEVRGARTCDDQHPGGARAEETTAEIAEPCARAQIRCDMRRIEVQGEGSQGAPPLAALHACGMELANLEGIEPHDAAPDSIGQAEEHGAVDHTSD